VEATAKAQRRRANRKSACSSVIRIELKDGMGNARWTTADLLDVSESGFGLALMASLKPGSAVLVRGKLGEHRSGDNIRAGVRWCIETTAGSYRAGMEFLDGSSGFTAGEEIPAQNDPELPDCYEVMQLSSNADADTIARVYRMLAMRYHPDNPQTGNSEAFVQLSEAHAILSDPQKRAGYDAQHRESKRLRWKIFDQTSATHGIAGEQRKRQGILGLLYAKTLIDPELAEMNIHLIEELLGCPREHLKAALWYLKGKNFIRRGDSGRYSLTIAGFEEAEAHTPPVATRAFPQLTEAKPAG
jgi:hypothetical protein